MQQQQQQQYSRPATSTARPLSLAPRRFSMARQGSDTSLEAIAAVAAAAQTDTQTEPLLEEPDAEPQQQLSGSQRRVRRVRMTYTHKRVLVRQETLELPHGVSLDVFAELMQWWYTGSIEVREYVTNTAVWRI